MTLVTTISITIIIFSDTCKIGQHNNYLKFICNDYKGNQYFKCLNSEVYYEIEAALPGYSKFSGLCENDPKFYQTCGGGHDEVFGSSVGALCGHYICQDQNGVYTSSFKADTSYSCDDKKQCINTDLDEADCSYNFVKVIFASVGGLSLPSSKICDNYCDLVGCQDEAICGNGIYGLFCNGLDYYPPAWIGYSNNQPDCAFDGSHTAENTCYHGLSNIEVPLFDFNRCAAFKYVKSAIDSVHWLNEEYEPYCIGFLDQTNCTDPERVAMSCTVNGYPSTISKNILCHGLSSLSLCNDGIENVCVILSPTCNVHKHQMCDNVEDCLDKSDENDIICAHVTSTACIRRLGERSLPTPLTWLRDGVTDCQDGQDEQDIWPTCGYGVTERYVTNNSYCFDDFICLHGNANFIGMDQLCDGIETCGNENKICSLSRDIPEVFTQTLKTESTKTKHLIFCHKGLLSLQQLFVNCSTITFSYPKGNVFGLSKRTSLEIPSNTMNCNHLFGELYLYYSCEGRCNNPNVVCPMKTNIRHDSCPGQYSDRTYTVVDNEELTFLFKSQGSYSIDLFVCDNNRCIPHYHVCDLVDDCGDGSDEKVCSNHFRCASNNSFISLSQKCNGVIDCLDLSDECNSQCSKRIIQNEVLYGLAWTIGILAVMFNCIILFPNIMALKDNTTSLLLLNKLLIMLISVGDLLVGGYLLIISIVHYQRGQDYCFTQQEWLTSSACSLLGIFSTIGSQFSLFAMTALSTVRLFGVRNSMNVGSRLTKFGVFKNVCVILMIVALSTAIAIIPLHPKLADVFVNGLSYDAHNPLFTGFPDKEKHLKVLEAYYGRMKEQSTKWHVIVDMVKGMFTEIYGGVTYKKVDFYGNDAVCLFKYFVMANDPQKLYVWVILGINFTCFGIITSSYTVISLLSMRSSKAVTIKGRRNSTVTRRNQQMNQKISIIILTDFCCWIPFILTCALHTFEVVDASAWYALFSIVVLPINSVINPLLFDTTISRILFKVLNKTKGVLSQNGLIRSHAGKSTLPKTNKSTLQTASHALSSQIVKLRPLSIISSGATVKKTQVKLTSNEQANVNESGAPSGTNALMITHKDVIYADIVESPV